MHKVLIVEDSPTEARTLATFIERYGETHGEKFQVTHLETAVDYVAGSIGRFDLVFMDIDLPGINGMEAAQLMRAVDEKTPLIFVTNLAQYAVRGYEVNALDFVVKPVSYADFSLRMDKALRALARQTTRNVVIRSQDGLSIVSVSEVAHVDISNHDLVYHLADGDTVRVRGSLGTVERELADTPLIRASNGSLVNIDFIQTIRADEFVMTTGDVIRMSRARRASVLAAIAEHLGSTR